jgi:hypothetical protein
MMKYFLVIVSGIPLFAMGRAIEACSQHTPGRR